MNANANFVLIVFVALVEQLKADVTMNYCSISCRDQQAMIANDAPGRLVRLVGPPGKRGATGLTGPPGPRGEQGVKGEAGAACSCEHVENNIDSLRNTVDRLKRKFKIKLL